ncbi:hypothetical protein J1D01_03760 [Seonamhaeicola sp. NFXS20]|uniref:hypothetical protein n=1 Tax=Seonamhaeicola sp. NFXS20 TaxID=2816959 RepID=UPI003B8C00E6
MDVIGIISLIIAILGIYPLILFIISFVNRPFIIIGILPFEEIESGKIDIKKLGKYDEFDEFHFNPKLFSKKIQNLKYSKLNKWKDRNRILKESKEEIYELPIIFNNIGYSDLMDYNLVVSFCNISKSNEVIQILEVETESAIIDALYCDDSYEGEFGKELIPSKEIRKYYNYLNLNDQLVIFKGSLESYVFELLYLKVKIPKSISEFYITYKVYPINKWNKSFGYSQIIKINATQEKT